jgi:phosphoglycerate kinase
MKTLRDISVQGQKVLVRADLNVPLDAERKITDDNRIKMFLPTMRYLLQQGCSIVIMSHLGDPPPAKTQEFSLAPVAARLSELLKIDVALAPHCIGPEVEKLVAELQPGSVLLLENLRFHPGEKRNDPEFARRLARYGDVFICDAFASAHRAHASLVGIPQFAEEAVAGLLVENELKNFSRALHSPKRPLCVVLGGAKISSKLPALLHLADKIDKLIVGGAMANTFLAAQGLQMGRSLYEPDLTPRVLELLGRLARRACHVYLPVDLVCAPSVNSVGLSRAVPSAEVPPELMALDIGPATSILYREALENVETVLWNGPMGAFEKEEFSQGTTKIIEALAASHAFTLVGGGDTDAAIHQMELAHKFDYISTGGGAFLRLLEGVELPAIRALND